MDKLDKLYRLHHLLDGRRVPIPRAERLRELEISWSTLKRLMRDLRERFNAPIVPVRDMGYVYDPKAGKMFELPGLWFNAQELLALVTIDELLKRLQPGLLDEQLAPLRARVEKLLASEHLGAGEAARRIRILRMASRAGDLPHFQTAAGAVLQRKRLAIAYFVRERDEETQREVSPQRLTHYRDNWYLDAWCHLRKALRSFAVECIRSAHLLEARADDIPDARPRPPFRHRLRHLRRPAHRHRRAALHPRARPLGRRRNLASRAADPLASGRPLRAFACPIPTRASWSWTFSSTGRMWRWWRRRRCGRACWSGSNEPWKNTTRQIDSGP